MSFDINNVTIRHFREIDAANIPKWIFDVEGWGTSAKFFKSCFKVDPLGCFIAELPNLEIIGICLGLNLSDDFAFGGSLVVRKEYRRKGVANLLCNERLKHVQNRLFGINSIENRIATNIKSGMSYPIFTAQMLIGDVNISALKKTLNLINNEKQKKKDDTIHYILFLPHLINEQLLQQIISYDERIHGINRDIFLRSLFENDEKIVQNNSNELDKQDIIGMLAFRFNNDISPPITVNSNYEMKNVGNILSHLESNPIDILGYGLIYKKYIGWNIAPLYAENEMIALQIWLRLLSIFSGVIRVDIIIPEDKIKSQLFIMIQNMGLKNEATIYRMYHSNKLEAGDGVNLNPNFLIQYVYGMTSSSASLV
ncbi:unnamed protein product [Gordionus sp. m RMFG-2023]|uniref:uncharacterized protein LOC135928617 n=1 Tax=Gordionus sp. m RMFG-2023 TaxID=3053472 RepID=UPI0030E07A06